MPLNGLWTSAYGFTETLRAKGTQRHHQNQQPSSPLFRCPSCETVYIAYTKETCGTCGTDVTQVR